MKGVSAKLTSGLNVGSWVFAADNSGARIVKIISVRGGKTRKGRQQYMVAGAISVIRLMRTSRVQKCSR